MKSLSRGLSLLALLAWGTLMLYFYFSGRLTEYLIPAYRPLVAISGGLMLLIAGTLAVGYRFGARWQLAAGPAVEDCPDDFAAPGRVRATQLLAFALLVVPLWAAASVSKDGFNATAMKNRGIVTDASHLPGKPSAAIAAASAVYEPPLPGATPSAADNNTPLDTSEYLKKTPSGHIIVEVTDLLFAAEDETMRPALENKTIELIGQYMPLANGNLSGKRFQLARMFMVCCAADARPVAVAVEPAAGVAKLEEMAWTRVVGKVTFPLENGRRQAVVQAESAAPSDPPSEAMLY
jgi:uncharacterized repeat protein (TIGR03943 family)